MNGTERMTEQIRSRAAAFRRAAELADWIAEERRDPLLRDARSVMQLALDLSQIREQLAEGEKVIADDAAWEAAIIMPTSPEDLIVINELFLAVEELTAARAEFDDAIGAIRDAEIEQNLRVQA
jgi:hypothetical protein